MSYRAVYRDANGLTYSAPLEWDAASSSYLMRTNEGLQKIVYLFRDDEAGNLFFECFREDAPTPPEPDTRLHVDGRGFRALQDAGAKTTAEYQTQRARERRAMLQALNEPDARKIAAARANATAMAQKWNPKRPEPIAPIQLTGDVMALAEQARWKRKIERQS